MGFSSSRLFDSQELYQVPMLGLDSAGKSSILSRIKGSHGPSHIVGFSVETVEFKNMTFTTWDISGQEALRPLWRFYYQSASALIYVVDSSNWQQMDKAREELHELLSEEELKISLVLVLANKQDLPAALSIAEVADQLALHTIRGRNWHIQGTSAVTGAGVYEGLDWLSDLLSRKLSFISFIFVSSCRAWRLLFLLPQCTSD